MSGLTAKMRRIIASWPTTKMFCSKDFSEHSDAANISTVLRRLCSQGEVMLLRKEVEKSHRICFYISNLAESVSVTPKIFIKTPIDGLRAAYPELFRDCLAAQFTQGRVYRQEMGR